MQILLAIGQGMEQPELIDELLDIEKNPKKPKYIFKNSYELAADFPLLLYDCVYDNLNFECSEEEATKTYDHFYVIASFRIFCIKDKQNPSFL